LRDLNQYANECMRELDLIGIPYCKPKRWKSSKKMTRTYGNCKSVRYLDGTVKEIKEIAINEWLLDEEIPDIILKNTIMHELIHTINHCGNHGNEFQKYAKIVSSNLGYRIQTYVSKEESKIVSERHKPKDYSYFVYCPNCGLEYGYRIKSYAWKHPEKCYCGKCGGTIKRREA